MRIRLLVSVSLAAILGCSTQPVDTAPAPVASPPMSHGLTVEEEAVVVRLEDRRELDKAIVAQWLSHPNALHRARIALALGRIGTATFDDADADGELDENESMAGVSELATLLADPDSNVRRVAAFALGEIGDKASVQPLLKFAADVEHADVAAEGVEALSKVTRSLQLTEYMPFTTSEREGVRARAIRFLFRFDTDDASRIAANALGDASAAVKREATYALSRRAYAPAQQKLELLLNDPDTLTRAYSARALGRIAAAESLLKVTEAVLDAHPWVRSESLRALAQIIGKTPALLSGPGTSETALRLITLSADSDPGTRATAIEALGKYAAVHEPSRKRLFELAETGSRWQRELVAAALAGNLADDGSLPLTKLIELNDPALLRGVLGASGTMKDGVQLRARLATNADASVRSSALGAIADDQVEAEAALIETGLSDPDVVVRATAIDRYSLRKEIPMVEMLYKLLTIERLAHNDPMNDARLTAITAIAGMNLSALPANDPSLMMLAADEDFQGVEPFLRGLLKDGDPMVRRAAADLIVNKLKKPRPQYTPLAINRPAEDYIRILQWSRLPHHATIHLARGDIRVQLLTQDAPLTAWNFAELAGKSYFHNTSFMRVVPNFVVQGGDPRNDQNGGPGYSIRDEMNLQKYTRGAVGMALSGPDTGGSQFFITHSQQPHLDGGYTIFGRVVGGMDEVVDQVERGDRVEKITIE